MSIENLEKRIEALEALIASYQLKHKYDGELAIKGLSISYEELIKRPDAQKVLIQLHNDMVSRLESFEERLEELEQKVHELENN